jgi:3'(2'), 5'-bisphosphate nucleotidase
VSHEADIAAADGARMLDELTGIVARAAAAIIAISRSDNSVRTKADSSPVTPADEASQAIIAEGLARIAPGVPVVSEESANRNAGGGASYVLVDPVDGTRELVAGRDEYTVNVAIVSGGIPILGVVAAPARGRLWRGVPGHCAERIDQPAGADWAAGGRATAIRTRPMAESAPVAVVSRSHLDASSEAFLARIPRVSRLPSGSAVKFCLLAEGAADLYPRLAPTSEWDVAAGHAVLAAAGGAVLTPAGAPLHYGLAEPTFRIGAFIAWGDPEAAAAFMARPA